ncbi:phage tail tube protein [Streptomyces graminifolii]|uniref:phage tail tube protein n=1 Tax=Streptomyces graminifolii TaxID=1266771 RepID=UPI004058AF08
MADLISDGKTRVAWVSSIANINAPTAAELTAGADYTKRITPDGLKLDPSTADVDTSSLASTFDTKTVGRVGFDTEITFKRGDTVGDDAPYTTLKYGVSGFLAIRRGVAYATAWTAGQVVEIYPITCGEPQNSSPAANEVMKFMSPMKVTDAPATAAVVA